ncbi:MAG: polymorphic toxin type 10 domain-containing protein, partial [Kiritimatiellales bacterium]
GGVNFYTYADGNPLNSIDPEGLCARPSLFGRTSQFGVRSANFGGFSQFGRTPGIASSYSSFGRPSSSPFGFSSPRSYYALSSPGYQMFDDSRNKWDSGHRWAAVGSAVREAFGRTSGFDQINSASSGYDTYSMHSLSAGQRLSAGVSGTISVGFWAAGSVGTLGRGVSVMAGTLTRSEVAASRATIANALPRNQTFARVMPMQHAENFLHGNGPIGLGGKYNEVFVTAADDLVGIKNVRNAQQRLGLFRNSAGTLPNLRGDAVVEFKLKSLNKAGWRSPIETRSPRGYGFMYGGKTSGDAREWLINSGTASEIEAYDIILRRLEP